VVIVVVAVELLLATLVALGVPLIDPLFFLL